MPSIAVLLALTSTMLLWGLSFVVTKIALMSFAPFALMFFRFALASLFFLAFFAVKGFPRLSRAGHLKLLLLSVLEPVLYFIFETYGLSLTSASESALIIALLPVAVAVLSRVFLGEKLSARGTFGIILSIAGIAVLVLGGGKLSSSGGSSLVGDLLILGAVASAAVYMILVRKLTREISSSGLTGLQIFYGALFFAPFYFLAEPAAAPILPESVAAVFFLAAGATIGGFLCYNFALSKISPAKAAIFINGIPVVTAIGAWIILGERLNLLQMLGAALVIFAVSLTSTSSERIARETEPNFTG